MSTAKIKHSAGWQTEGRKQGTDWHVLPVNDLKAHWRSAGCWCCPRVERQLNGARVIVHNAADMREFVYEGKNKVKN